MDVFITPIQFGGAAGDLVVYSYYSGGAFTDYNLLYLDMSHTTTEVARRTSVLTSIASYATTNSYTVSKIFGTEFLGTDASTHISNAATDAPNNSPTNLNTLTTLLGSLTGQVNSTNANQNAIADKYNDLAARFNTLLGYLQTHLVLLP